MCGYRAGASFELTEAGAHRDGVRACTPGPPPRTLPGLPPRRAGPDVGTGGRGDQVWLGAGGDSLAVAGRPAAINAAALRLHLQAVPRSATSCRTRWPPPARSRRPSGCSCPRVLLPACRWWRRACPSSAASCATCSRTRSGTPGLRRPPRGRRPGRARRAAGGKRVRGHPGEGLAAVVSRPRSAARRPGAPDGDSGAGTGLTIARGLVEAHHGDIRIENAGPGCRVVVRLPVAFGV